MTTRELLHEKRDEIPALAAKHKAHNVCVSGRWCEGRTGRRATWISSLRLGTMRVHST
jgi:hypothetical protein